jgi:hypothetical protein
MPWGGGARTRAVHSFILLVVGNYAGYLILACPRWLAENIAAEAEAIDTEEEKTKWMFRISLCVLFVLNFCCVALTALAHRATTGQDILQLVTSTCEDARKRSDAIAVVRWSYAISVCVLMMIAFLLAGIGLTTEFPNLGHFLLGWFPAFYPLWVIMQLVTFVWLMASLALNEVEDYYSQLEATEVLYTGYWLHMLCEHQALTKKLRSVSRSITPTVLLLENVLLCSSLLFLWVTLVSRRSPKSATMYVFMAFVTLSSGVMTMLPLAFVTDLCETRRLGERSLRTLADKFSGWQMSFEVHAEYMRFMQHINTTPAGIHLPSIGMVNRQCLVRRIVLLARCLPFVLTFTLGLIE